MKEGTGNSGRLQACHELNQREIGKVQLEVNLATGKKVKKKCFSKYINNKKRAKENFNPLLHAGVGTLPPAMRKKLRHSMPSLPQPLIKTPVILRISSPLSGKSETQSRMRAPFCRRKSLVNCCATQTCTSLGRCHPSL